MPAERRPDHPAPGPGRPPSTAGGDPGGHEKAAEVLADGASGGARQQSLPRRGIDVAREALAAARAAARARGQRAAGTAGPGGAGAKRPAGDQRALRRTETRSGAHADDRDPQPLGRSIERLMADRGWELDLAVGGVMGRWDTIVGAEVAGHCQPETFDEGVLTVRAETTAWATQLRLLSALLLRRLNAELGAGTVTRVRVLGPTAPSWVRGRRSVRGRGPRDTYG